MAKENQLLLALDLGTTGVRTIAFNHQGEVVAKEYQPLRLLTPRPGWVEQDPEEIWQQSVATLQTVVAQVGADRVLSLSITNQRESCLLWNKETGKPLANLISWQDTRTTKICQDLAEYAAIFKDRTGLFLQSYSTGSKLKWLVDHLDFELETTLFGTLDTWLLWKLTAGKVFATEPSNASRTLFYNIKTHQYDQHLLDLLGLSHLPSTIFPEVLPSNSDFGLTDSVATGVTIPIHTILGDQQASLYSHTQFGENGLKCTYGTGAFVMLSCGQRSPQLPNLITTIAGQIDDQFYYAIEGSILMGGALVQWLKDNLQLITTLEESTLLAQSLETNQGVYCVPAFSGLGAPYWDATATGIFRGLNHQTTKAHLVRAALEAIAYQVNDVVSALRQHLPQLHFSQLKCDGGATVNPFLMQFQADVLDLEVVTTQKTEGTAWGVVGLAGISQQYWTSAEFTSLTAVQQTYSPDVATESRTAFIAGWHQAVAQSRTQ